MMRAWLAGALVSAVASALLAVSGRVWRRPDAACWHALWTLVAVASTVGVFLVPLFPAIAITAGPSRVASVLRTAMSGPWMSAAIWVYAAGFTCVAGRVLAGVVAALRLQRDARLPDAALRERVAAIAPAHASLVRVHSRMAVPITIGWWRRGILLPVSAAAWTDARLSAVLHHEAAHVDRRDVIWHSIAALHRSIWWCSPFAWMLARRVRLLAELAADDRAAACVGRASYARQLLGAAEEHNSIGVAGILAPGALGDVSVRIKALAATRITRPVSRFARAAIGVGIIGLVALPMFLSVAASPDAHAAIHAAKHQHPH